MRITPTQLRRDVYKIVDAALKGDIIEVKRGDEILRLVPIKPKSKLKNLKGIPNLIIGNPADLKNLDWTHEWKP